MHHLVQDQILQPTLPGKRLLVMNGQTGTVLLSFSLPLYSTWEAWILDEDEAQLQHPFQVQVCQIEDP